MKFKYTSKETFKTVGKIKEAFIKFTEDGTKLVELVMQDGKIFINSKAIWDEIGININSINEGDELEIEYSTYIYKNHTNYFKFWNIVNKSNLEACRILTNSHLCLDACRALMNRH